jgi:hypothetical protein
MEPIILVAGSAVGAFTALIAGKVSKGQGNTNSFTHNHNTYTHSADLQRRIVTEAMNRVYYYERQGRITGNERERLLAKYRQELNALDNNNGMHGVTLYNLKELNAFKEHLVTVVDQRMAQINSKLDDITSKVGSNTPVVRNKPATNVERKEEKRTERPVEQVEIVESAESAESDTSLDEIKKQIMQTLSRLEQAEVE